MLLNRERLVGSCHIHQESGGKDRAQSGERLSQEVIMCDSGLVPLSLLTLLGTFIAFQTIFNPFGYNCNSFYSDDVVQAITY